RGLAGRIAAARGTPAVATGALALTDGVANVNRNNNAALAALNESGAPFIGVGIGRDSEVSSLSLRRVAAPEIAPPKQGFHIGAELQAVTTGEIPACNLLLLRDDKLVQTRRLNATRGSRLWTESFEITEETEGVHQFTVLLQLPQDSTLTCLHQATTVQVNITKESELRVLFVQGKLTWDFKFIGRALSGDPSLKVTGLSRTSVKSVFRQNVEKPGELTSGFPVTMEEISPFRLVVISGLKPADLTADQQEIVARFCRELGGGVLLLGGPSTFDSSWQGSKLEQLLPVTFDANQGVLGVDRPFHLELTDEAFRSPVFQIAGQQENRAAWDHVPSFVQYGRVAAAKPGATVWGRHQDDSNAAGKRILMASQRYGAGLSAVICIENFWRWRMAKDVNVQQFDRFWQQLFRYLGQAGRKNISLRFTDAELRLNSDVHLVVERKPDPDSTQPGADNSAQQYKVVVYDPAGRTVFDQKCELLPSRPVDLTFHAETEGVYVASVLDSRGMQLASTSIELRTGRIELERTARDMENLRQWAALSHGIAVKAEDCADAGKLLETIRQAVEKADTLRNKVTPAGINAWVMGALLLSLGGEWMLRKKWRLS
ncbi:MAG: hypothetical protein WCH43_10065, partial [Verrucomicrobiota bacterium]